MIDLIRPIGYRIIMQVEDAGHIGNTNEPTSKRVSRKAHSAICVLLFSAGLTAISLSCIVPDWYYWPVENRVDIRGNSFEFELTRVQYSKDHGMYLPDYALGVGRGVQHDAQFMLWILQYLPYEIRPGDTCVAFRNVGYSVPSRGLRGSLTLRSDTLVVVDTTTFMNTKSRKYWPRNARWVTFEPFVIEGPIPDTVIAEFDFEQLDPIDHHVVDSTRCRVVSVLQKTGKWIVQDLIEGT
jgi:hypothetical protein